MTKSILIIGASKGISRATVDALLEKGWSVIGVARSSPGNFPGEFIRMDVADQDQTRALSNALAARRNLLGIVNNVGVGLPVDSSWEYKKT